MGMKEIRINVADEEWLRWRVLCLKHGGAAKTLTYLIQNEENRSRVMITPKH
jgi:hypothetical protein